MATTASCLPAVFRKPTRTAWGWTMSWSRFSTLSSPVLSSLVRKRQQLTTSLRLYKRSFAHSLAPST